MPLLSFMWADHELNDISWLRADTFSWQSGSVYTAVYSHLSDDITGKTLQSETISGTTVQFYIADDGHKICPAGQESNVTAIYNATGVAWYYIIDTTNQRFKLPRTKFGFTGIRSGVGNYVAPGLPNITGNTHWVGAVLNNNNTSYANGVFSAFDSNSGAYAGGGGYSNAAGRLSFDASRSSGIYGSSSTVQPKATEMYLYFYVGSFKQTAIENTAGLNAELFNEKADLSYVNNNVRPAGYYYYRWEGLTAVSSAISHTFTVSSKRGNPIVVSINGDLQNNSGAGWASVAIYKGTTKMAKSVVVCSGTSNNACFNVMYIDTAVSAGDTCEYTIKIRETGDGTLNFQEDEVAEAPRICAYEI